MLPAFTVVEHWMSKYVQRKSGNWPVASSKNYINNFFFCKENRFILLSCLLNVELMDFHEIWHGCYATGGNSTIILFIIDS
jgi:hypothetical protein